MNMPWRTPGALALAIATSWLTGCTTEASRTVCPHLYRYDQAELDRAADELQGLPEGSAIEGMLADYATTRAEIRAVCPP